jgi:RNA polymerase sigma factor (sigma-70 family)
MGRILLTLLARLYDTHSSSPERVSDADLLDSFVRRTDAAAFELLFWRHARLVWGACRRVLGDSPEAEDAFQATFLVLAQKAACIGRGEALAAWLYRVAWRTAQNAAKARRRRAAHEHALANHLPPQQSLDPGEQVTRDELSDVLDQELLRLPEKYRLPLILCHLEAQSHETAAAALGCPLGTLNSRLARGRRLLKQRLLRRGVSLSALAAVSLAPSRAGAALTAVLRTPAPVVRTLAVATIRGLALTAALKGVAAALLAGVLLAGLAFATWPMHEDFAEPAVLAMGLADGQAPSLVDPNAGPLPTEVLKRIGSTRFRHWGDVTSLAYSPDGKWLGSISAAAVDATARLWDTATGIELLRVKINVRQAFRSVPAPDQVPQAVGFSADSKQFLVVDAVSLRGLDIATGQERFAQVFAGENQAFDGIPRVAAAGLAPDGKTLVLARRSAQLGPQGDLEVRDVLTGKVRANGQHPFGNYSSVPIAFSRDGRRFAVGVGNAQPVPIYDTASAVEVGQVRVKDQSINQVCFLPNENLLAVLLASQQTAFERTVGFYDLKKARLVRSVKVDGATYSLAVSPDGKLMFAGNGQKRFSQLLDVVSGKEIGRVPSRASLLTLAFSPDGNLLAAARPYSGAISIYDIPGRRHHPLSAEPVSFIGTRFSTDGRTLHSTWSLNPTIDWRTGAMLSRPVEPDPDGFLPVVTSPDGKLLAVTAWQRPIKLVDASTGAVVRQLTGSSEAAGTMVFSADGRRIATGHWDKRIRVWDLVAGREFAQFKAPELLGSGDLALSENGKVLAVSCDGGMRKGNFVYTWDVDARRQLARIEAPTRFFSHLALSPDGRLVAGGGGQLPGREEPRNGTAVTVWDAYTGTALCSLPGHRAEKLQPGADCEFSPDGRLLVSGDAAGQLRLWEVASGQEIHRFEGHHSFVSAHFSPDGRLLVAASEDAPCFLWEVVGTDRSNQPAAGLDAEGLWSQLAARDAKVAFGAMRRLVASSVPAVQLLRQQLKPAVGVDQNLVAKLLHDLDDDVFAQREAAAAELLQLADRIGRRLEEARGSAFPEARQRLDQILEKMREPRLQRLRESRALTVLEWLATPEADQLLDQLAGGAPEDPLTQGAGASSARSRRRARRDRGQ